MFFGLAFLFPFGEPFLLEPLEDFFELPFGLDFVLPDEEDDFLFVGDTELKLVSETTDTADDLVGPSFFEGDGSSAFNLDSIAHRFVSSTIRLKSACLISHLWQTRQMPVFSGASNALKHLPHI
ncbi:MAG: hypothetical protein MZV70_36285 [Desulfobacterales bacterium]|nr:hypothetical protein [Desulfobacterales bacterium]